MSRITQRADAEYGEQLRLEHEQYQRDFILGELRDYRAQLRAERRAASLEATSYSCNGWG